MAKVWVYSSQALKNRSVLLRHVIDHGHVGVLEHLIGFVVEQGGLDEVKSSLILYYGLL
jgi:hypothetical protein